VLGLYFHVPMNGTTACEKLFIILEVEDGDMEIKKANRPVKGTDSIIELDDVSFAYVENQPVLKNANLKIRKDEFVSLVGKSGCGKSTIAGLIMGHARGYTGDLYIDGIIYYINGDAPAQITVYKEGHFCINNFFHERSQTIK